MWKDFLIYIPLKMLNRLVNLRNLDHAINLKPEKPLQLSNYTIIMEQKFSSEVVNLILVNASRDNNSLIVISTIWSRSLTELSHLSSTATCPEPGSRVSMLVSPCPLAGQI